MKPLFSGRAYQSRSRFEWRAKVGRAIGVEVDFLHRCVAVTITSSITIRSGVIYVPDFLAIGAGEEARNPSVKSNEPNKHQCLPVMSRAVVAIRRSKNGSRLRPAPTQRWVATSIPGEQTQAILRSPTVASRVGDIGLATIVHGCRAFHNGSTILLPALGGCGKDLRRADLAGRGERCDAEGLQAVRHARPDEVVAPATESYDAAINAPSVGQGCEVGVGLERIGAA